MNILKKIVIVLLSVAVGVLLGVMFPEQIRSLGSNLTEKVTHNHESGNAFGIDVSHYQEKINWSTVDSKHPVEFAIMRCTMGESRIDTEYLANITAARAKGLIVGSYHYYDPNENSTKQAEHFCKHIEIRRGDFRPVLDIEKMSRIQTPESLVRGVKNFCEIVRNKFGCDPIIYSGLSFYQTVLQADFPEDKYSLWLAAYSEHRRDEVLAIADVFQFTERVRIEGIKILVDGNDIPRQNLLGLLHK